MSCLKSTGAGPLHSLPVRAVRDDLGRSHQCEFSSVQFSRSVVSDSLRPHGLQHLSITNNRSVLRLMSIVSVMPLRPSQYPGSIAGGPFIQEEGKASRISSVKQRHARCPPPMSPGARTLISPTDTKSMLHSVIKTFYVVSSLNSHLGGFYSFVYFLSREVICKRAKRIFTKKYFFN